MIFTSTLQEKINYFKQKQVPINLGKVKFSSNLLLAPMSAICNYPFRYLMQCLGSGGSVSELISCHGINYQNEKTLKMLYINEKEKNVGIQLFGEDIEAMTKAAKFVQNFHPSFIDLNLGCPVNKVVKKGGGSALLRDTKKLSILFKNIKTSIEIPLTIKIRTGWDDQTINAREVIHIAFNEGVEFVAIHGRTRAQQYKGQADWNLLEEIASTSPLPIIGNGDLSSPFLCQQRTAKTNCKALMIGRGALRNPFIFLESEGLSSTLNLDQKNYSFSPRDYKEIIEFYDQLICQNSTRERHRIVQLKKMSVWFLAGFPGISKIRNDLFAAKEIKELKSNIYNFLDSLEAQNIRSKTIDQQAPFMAGGHG